MSLASWFERVTATDASAAQIGAAKRHPNVEYRVAPAEDSGLADASVDLLTVAQALHWFDIPRFFAEAVRVLAPGGILAVWSYEHCGVEPGIDALVRRLYESVDAWWPPERRLVESRYAGIDLPMPAVASPEFEMTIAWTAEAMLGYLRTWSACQRYLHDRGTDPVSAIEGELRSRWGSGERQVRWPLTLKIGRTAGR